MHAFSQKSPLSIRFPNCNVAVVACSPLLFLSTQIEMVGTGVIKFVQLLEAEDSADIQENRRSCTEITCKLIPASSTLPPQSQKIGDDVRILLKRMFPLYQCTLKLESADKEKLSVT